MNLPLVDGNVFCCGSKVRSTFIPIYVLTSVFAATNVMMGDPSLSSIVVTCQDKLSEPIAPAVAYS